MSSCSPPVPTPSSTSSGTFPPSHSPDFTLETSTFVTCVAFHPFAPSLLVAGTFGGEILVWDLAGDREENEEEEGDKRGKGRKGRSLRQTRSNGLLYASSSTGEYFHREPITQIAWVRDDAESQLYSTSSSSHSTANKAGSFRIVSVSAEGKVLYWSLRHGLSVPSRGYLLRSPPSKSGKGRRTPDSPDRRSRRGEGRDLGGRTGDREGGVVVGATAIAFPSLSSASSSSSPPVGKSSRARGGESSAVQFLVASETGNLFHCYQESGRQDALPPMVRPREWSEDALSLLLSIGSRQTIRDIAVHVTSSSSSSSSSASSSGGGALVTAKTIFASRPPVHKLYPSPIVFTFRGSSKQGEGRDVIHGGGVSERKASPSALLSLATPQCRGAGSRHLFSSCGTDGALRLHHTLEERPLLSLPLAEGHLLCAKW